MGLYAETMLNGILNEKLACQGHLRVIDCMFCSEGDVDGRVHGKREIDCSEGSRGRLGVYVPI